MRNSTALFRARVPASRLKRVEKILDGLGLKPGDALNMLLAQIEIRKGLPFEVKQSAASLQTSEEQGAVWSEKLGVY